MVYIIAKASGGCCLILVGDGVGEHHGGKYNKMSGYYYLAGETPQYILLEGRH